MDTLNDSEGKPLVVGADYIIIAKPRRDDYPEWMYEDNNKSVGVGKTVTVKQIIYAPERETMDVQFKYNDSERLRWLGGPDSMFKLKPYTGPPTGGKRSKRRKKRRRTRKN